MAGGKIKINGTPSAVNGAITHFLSCSQIDVCAVAQEVPAEADVGIERGQHLLRR